ncbi:hypothetical protein [Caulobacter sp. LARHSG274]
MPQAISSARRRFSVQFEGRNDLGVPAVFPAIRMVTLPSEVKLGESRRALWFVDLPEFPP